jgi:hypothetical protein
LKGDGEDHGQYDGPARLSVGAPAPGRQVVAEMGGAKALATVGHQVLNAGQMFSEVPTQVQMQSVLNRVGDGVSVRIGGRGGREGGGYRGVGARDLVIIGFEGGHQVIFARLRK